MVVAIVLFENEDETKRATAEFDLLGRSEPQPSQRKKTTTNKEVVVENARKRIRRRKYE